jgi:sphingomyelin phosphodiesterase acid-like 3
MAGPARFGYGGFRVRVNRNAGVIVGLFSVLAVFGPGVAQGRGAEAAKSGNATAKVSASAVDTVPALFLSDIHFDPFADPAKVPQLAASPVAQWKSILSSPASADREQRSQALQQTCHAKGTDTPYALLDSGLQAMRAQAAGTKFITVSGDSMAHAFACKSSTLLPNNTPEVSRDFAEKTLAFVLSELAETFPGVPVYLALGNNDSDCGDYKLDAHSAFLADTGKEVAKTFPASERTAVEDTFGAGGYYNVALPVGLPSVRLLVLNDLFWSKKYATCAGKPDAAQANEQLAWLAKQLEEARTKEEKVWVMGHIPPGVDVHGTVTKFRDVCGGQAPEMFLSSEKMADEMAAFPDVISLGIFAHTHMDEMRSLKPPGDAQGKGVEGSVPVKMVPSISPIDGNLPSFTVARVDPVTGILLDYRVIVASNGTGVDTVWREEYDYFQTFKQTGFSQSAVDKLIAGFQADESAGTDASRAYIHNFIAGQASPLLGLVWPQYTCSLSNYTADSYRSCVCAAKK